MTLKTKPKPNQAIVSQKVSNGIELSIPRRVIFGYLFIAGFVITPLFYSGEHLNSVSISMQILLYLFWASGITLLHREIKEVDSDYQFGPKESMVGALVPFSYIFWNFHWISVMWKELELGAFSFRHNNYVVGLLAALASCACYPDNMDKIPQAVPVCGFILLFSITWIFTNRIRTLKVS